MSVVNYDGIKVSQIDEEKIVLLDPNKIDLTIDFMKANNLKCISLGTDDLVANDLNFLKKFTFITSFRLFIDDEDFNLSGLEFLINLESLTILEEHKFVVDLSNFKKLNSLDIVWKKQYEIIFDINNLKHLRLFKYKSKDLSRFSVFQELKTLMIYQGSIKNFSGLEDLNKLESLKAVYLQNLETTQYLPENLKFLDLTNCPKIQDLNYIKNLKFLEKLWVDSCKEIQSLNPIKDLKNLNKVDLMGNTRVIDGDMSPLFGVSKVRFMHFRHYSHKDNNFND